MYRRRVFVGSTLITAAIDDICAIATVNCSAADIGIVIARPKVDSGAGDPGKRPHTIVAASYVDRCIVSIGLDCNRVVPFAANKSDILPVADNNIIASRTIQSNARNSGGQSIICVTPNRVFHNGRFGHSITCHHIIFRQEAD